MVFTCSQLWLSPLNISHIKSFNHTLTSVSHQDLFAPHHRMSLKYIWYHYGKDYIKSLKLYKDPTLYPKEYMSNKNLPEIMPCFIYTWLHSHILLETLVPLLTQAITHSGNHTNEARCFSYVYIKNLISVAFKLMREVRGKWSGWSTLTGRLWLFKKIFSGFSCQ